MFPILLLLHPASAGPWNQEANIHHLLSKPIHTHHAVPGSCTCLRLIGFLFHWPALIRSLLRSSHVWTSDTPSWSFEKQRWLHARVVTQVFAHLFIYFCACVLNFKGWCHFLRSVQSSCRDQWFDPESGSRRTPMAPMCANVGTQHGRAKWERIELECKLGLNLVSNNKSGGDFNELWMNEHGPHKQEMLHPWLYRDCTHPAIQCDVFTSVKVGQVSHSPRVD